MTVTCLGGIRAYGFQHPFEGVFVRLARVSHRLGAKNALEVVSNPQQSQGLLRFFNEQKSFLFSVCFVILSVLDASPDLEVYVGMHISRDPTREGLFRYSIQAYLKNSRQ